MLALVALLSYEARLFLSRYRPRPGQLQTEPPHSQTVYLMGCTPASVLLESKRVAMLDWKASILLPRQRPIGCCQDAHNWGAGAIPPFPAAGR